MPRIAILLLLATSLRVHAQWTNTGGGDHGGADWTPANGTFIAGVHTNIGTFTVTGGTTVYVQPYDGTNYGSVDIYTNTAININGTLSGDQAGYLGGAGGGGGADGGSCTCGAGGNGVGGSLGGGPAGSGGTNGTAGSNGCPISSGGGGGAGSYGAAGGGGGTGNGGSAGDD